MQREKPFLYIDTNFCLSEQVMLKLAFNSFDFEIVGISTVSSFMDSKMAAENIVAMSEKEDLFLSVTAGACKNILEQDIITKAENKRIFKNQKDYVDEGSSVDKLYEIAQDCGKLDIIATGPLTNIAKALRIYPDIEDYIDHIFILGSSFSIGDVTSDAEFNFFTDPVAADEILNSSIEIFILPLELSNSLVLNDERLNKLEAKDDILSGILYQYENLDENLRELKAAILLYLVQKPQAFIFEQMSLKVNREENRGKIEKVNNRKKVYVANRLNEDSFFDYLEGNL